MPDLKKVDDTRSRIHYAHPHGGGWVIAAIGLAGLLFAVSSLEGGARFGAIGLAVFFIWGGISSARARFELTVDFDRRRIRYLKGYVFNPERGEESFDLVERVVLKKEIERKGTKEVVDEWEVELELRGWPRPVEVFESKEESPARAEAEMLADRLGVPMSERTGR